MAAKYICHPNHQSFANKSEKIQLHKELRYYEVILSADIKESRLEKFLLQLKKLQMTVMNARSEISQLNSGFVNCAHFRTIVLGNIMNISLLSPAMG